MLKFLLLVALVALSECQQLSNFCFRSQRRMVRLTNGSSYAGIVEMCWQVSDTERYGWQPVCSQGWTSSLASQVCKELNISVAVIDIQAVSFGEKQSRNGEALTLQCNSGQGCSLQTVDVQFCYYDNFAAAICDLPLQNPSAQTSTPCSTTDVATAATQHPLDCRECSVSATSSTSGQSDCTVLAGVLGSVIAIVLVLLVGILIGCLWMYRRNKNTVLYIDPSSEAKVEIAAVRPQPQMDSGGHDNNYATISEHVHQVPPTNSSSAPSRPVMYDTIEDRVTPTTTTGGGGGGRSTGEHLYHELDGYNGSSRETRTDRNNTEGTGILEGRETGRYINTAAGDAPNQLGQSGSYYEVPIKST